MRTSQIDLLRVLLSALLLLSPVALYGEENNSWEYVASANLYILPEETYLNPIFSADKGPLHLEARYNYEDLDTTSLFAGYNFSTGEKLQLNLTPIVGWVFGNSDGIAPGLLFELNYSNISLSSECEYFVSSDEKESNFFYAWSELTYSPAEWIWIGIAGQRTRAYDTDLEVQRGFLLGVSKGNFSITGYLMNPGWDDPFGLIAMEYSF